MLQYVVRRGITLIPVLFIVSALTFFGLELVPVDDPIELILGPGATFQGTQAEYDALLEQYGLGGSVIERYVEYLGRLVQGDLGRSSFTRQPVTDMFAQRMPVTLWLNSITFVTNIVVGVGLGTLAGLYHGTKIDFGATALAVLSVAVPGFWVAILSIIVFSLWLGWFPTSGWVSPFDDPVNGIKHLALPVFALGIFGSASILRQTRSALIEVVRQDYVRTARAKGLSEGVIVRRHMLRAALLPVITLLGFQIANLFSGSVLIERVFGLPGIGRMALDATERRDFPVVQAVVMVAAFAIVIANLIADLLYAWLDPRIRYS